MIYSFKVCKVKQLEPYGKSNIIKDSDDQHIVNTINEIALYMQECKNRHESLVAAILSNNSNKYVKLSSPNCTEPLIINPGGSAEVPYDYFTDIEVFLYE